MRVLLYAKMLKETKTEETIVFFVTFLSLVAFQLGGGAGTLGPLGYAYGYGPDPFLTIKKSAVLEPRTGHFQGLVGFKDFKMCPRGLRLW